MNHVNFNDGLLLPQDFLALSEEGMPVQELPDRVLQSPLFLWDGPEEVQLKSLSNMDIHNKIREQPHALPFQTMRLYIRSGISDRSWGIKGFKIWMHHVDKILYARVMRVGVEGDEKIVLGITTTIQGDRVRAFYRKGANFVGPPPIFKRKAHEGIREWHIHILVLVHSRSFPPFKLHHFRVSRQERQVRGVDQSPNPLCDPA